MRISFDTEKTAMLRRRPTEDKEAEEDKEEEEEKEKDECQKT